MAETYYQIPDFPAYDPKIRSLQNSDPANAETTFNPLFQRLIENIAAVKNLVPGKNLLDNWYFVDPINQRGKTEGFVAGEYTIDRWYSRSGENNLSPAFTENGLLLAESGSGIGHVFEDSVFNAVVNKQVTLSFFTSSGELGVITQIVDPNNTMETILASTTGYDASLYRWNGSAYGRFQVLLYHSRIKETTNTDTIVAVKLELGSVQTLAHQDANGNWVLNDPPPNKTLELEKCQRYWQKIPNLTLLAYGSNDVYANDFLFTFQKMRVVPTITVYSYDGTANVVSSLKNGTTIVLNQAIDTAFTRGVDNNCALICIRLPEDFAYTDINQITCNVTLDADL